VDIKQGDRGPIFWTTAMSSYISPCEKELLAISNRQVA
jgi:hypothetical protein